MKDVLKVGQVQEMDYRVTRDRTVPALYPDAPEFQEIPEVFASGYLIGLLEWCCIKALAPCLEDGEGSLGTHVQSSHVAPTPPGGTVHVTARITEIDGRRVRWDVVARDDLDEIGRGVIERTVVSWDRFEEKLARKAAQIGAATDALAGG